MTMRLAEESVKFLDRNTESKLSDLISLEKTNNQLTNFCQRILNKRGSLDPLKTSFLYVIIWNLEKIADEYKYICEYCSGHKVEKGTMEALKEVNALLREYYELFYRFDLKRLSALSDKYKLLQKSLESSLPENKDAVILSHLSHIVLKIADFSASTFAIND